MPDAERVCVVAGAGAWPFYLATQAWVGQENRRFGGATRLGFYSGRQIQGLVPRIQHVVPSVDLDGRIGRGAGAQRRPRRASCRWRPGRRPPRRDPGRSGGRWCCSRVPRTPTPRRSIRCRTTVTRPGRCSSASPTSTLLRRAATTDDLGGGVMATPARTARRVELAAWFEGRRAGFEAIEAALRAHLGSSPAGRAPRRRPAGDPDQVPGELLGQGHQVRRPRRLQVRRPADPADRLRGSPGAGAAQCRRRAGGPPGPAPRTSSRRCPTSGSTSSPTSPATRACTSCSGSATRTGGRSAWTDAPDVTGRGAGALDPPARLGGPPARPDVQGRAASRPATCAGG